MMSLGADDVLLSLRVPDKGTLLRRLAQHAATRIGRDATAIFALLQAREALGPTGIGRGVALPHARMAGSGLPFCCFCRLEKPIPFDAIDSAPVDLVILLLTAADADSGHLALLAAAARLLRDPVIAMALRHADDAAAVLRILQG